MNRFILGLIFLLVISFPSFSQTWHTLYNGLYLSHFEELSSHEIILTGNSFSFLSSDSTNIVLIKSDSIGNIIWSKGFGSNRHDYGNYAIQCHDSGYVIVGYTNGYNSSENDIILIKTNYNGIVEWTKVYGGNFNDQAYVVLQTPDNGFIIGGHTHSLSFFPGSLDIFLLKTDSLGNVQWTKTYGDGADNNFYDLNFTSDSSYLVLGRTGNYAGYGFFNFYLMKINTSGQLLWERGYGTSDEDSPTHAHQTMDGGYVACGTTWSSNAEMYVVKTDSLGGIQWAKVYGTGMDNNIGTDIIQTADSDYILIGGSDLLTETVSSILKLDKNGDTIWTRTYQDYQWDMATQIRSSSSSYLIQTKTFLIKTDSLGITGCNNRSLSYYYSDTPTLNYLTFPMSSTPYWPSNRTILIDTINGVTSSPVCSTAGFAVINNDSNSISIFPNPALNKINITTSNVISIIEIYNLFGERLHVNISTFNNENAEIDISKLKAGAYILKLYSLKNTSVHLFIKSD
jgi:hypothetical protein